jgi:hypothetical protein
MENRVLFGVMTLIFNSVGVPCFMAGKAKEGVWRIILGCITCGVIGFINEIMGIIMGIKILCMSDEEFAAKKNEMFMGIPGVKFDAAPKAEKTEETEE